MSSRNPRVKNFIIKKLFQIEFYEFIINKLSTAWFPFEEFKYSESFLLVKKGNGFRGESEKYLKPPKFIYDFSLMKNCL